MKREDLLLVTPAKFRGFKPCWLETREGCARFERIAAVRGEWSALDVLDLEDVSARDKLWAVLREAFLPAMLLHEFACRCAEYALSLVENPDARSAEAIRVKRRWVNGDATDKEMAVARKDLTRALSGECGEPYNFQEQKDAWFCVLDATGYNAEDSAVCASTNVAERNTTHSEPEIAILRKLIDEWEN